jgi:hypothetical protein
MTRIGGYNCHPHLPVRVTAGADHQRKRPIPRALAGRARFQTPKTSKSTASQVHVIEGVGEGRSEDLDDYTVSFSSYTADHESPAAFKGLPDDRCQARHWGYVLAGKVAFRYVDREETFEAGDAFYAPPGHTPPSRALVRPAPGRLHLHL